MMNVSEHFAAIRAAYKAEMPKIKRQWDSGDQRIDPYFVDWIPMFTPIEMSVWQDIRSMGMPLLPQVPALRYFVDFGNPFLKVAVECDGKAWHDEEKDAKRDAALMDAGWTIYRITGSECNRIVPAPWEVEAELSEEENDEVARNYFLNSASGIMYAIKHEHFPRPTMTSRYAKDYFDLMQKTLYLHSPNLKFGRAA